jgi:hypothetical protein
MFMKKYILLFLFALLLSFVFCTANVLSDASLCHHGFVGDQCCDGKYGPSYCLENIDWGYCGGNETWQNGDMPTNCTGDNDFWSNSCCCFGNAALNCFIPDIGLNDKRIWGDNLCERDNITIGCNGVVDSHYICNSTYYITPNKCALAEPSVNFYSVSRTSVTVGNNFSISVYGNLPFGLRGKYLIECVVIHPDGYKIYVDTWSNENYLELPNVTCDKLGNYIVDYCGIYTDFLVNKGWGSQDDANTTVSCISNTEFEPPKYIQDGDDSGGSVIEGTDVSLYVKWQDNTGLGKSLVRTNMTGDWQNYTSCYLTGNSDWCNKTLNTEGFSGKICWNQWANDTLDNINKTMPEDLHCFNIIEVPDTNPPTYASDGDNSGGSIREGTAVTANTLWNDNKGLSSVSIVHNETGEWVASSYPISGKSQWLNYNINTNNDTEKIICWYQNSTDLSGNKNDTMKDHIHCFNVVSSTASTSENNAGGALDSIRGYISSYSSEFSLRIITLAFELMGIIILVILLVTVVFQLVQSH